MRIEDIQSFADLEKYVKMELARQTATSRTVQLVLPEVWFFKFGKLICFSLKNEEKERYAKMYNEIGIPEDCKKMVCKINKVFTVILKK